MNVATNRLRPRFIKIVVGVLGIAIYSFIVILAIGLLLTDYSSLLILLIGVVCSFPLAHLLRALWVAKLAVRGNGNDKTVSDENTDLRADSEAHHRPGSSIWRFSGMLLLMIFTIILGILISLEFFTMQQSAPHCAVVEYHITFDATAPTIDAFVVSEELILAPEIVDSTLFEPGKEWVAVTAGNRIAYRLPSRYITGTTRGFLLKEVSFEPTQDWHTSVGFPHISAYDLSTACSKTSLELRQFPRDSFYEAENASGLERYPFIDTETVTWIMRDPNVSRLKFAYIPPPYYHLRPALPTWFISMFFNGHWVALIFVMIFMAFNTLVGISYGKKLFQRTPKNAVKKTEPIASDNGTEKEIDVEGDSQS